jgi:hypothetical protein
LALRLLAPLPRLRGQADLVQQKGKVEAELAQVLVPVRRREVPRRHVDLAADYGRLRVAGTGVTGVAVATSLPNAVPQRGGELADLPVLDAGVVQTTRQQTGRVLDALLHVLHRTVLHHVRKVLGLVGVAPLGPLGGSQGNRSVCVCKG